MFEFELNIKVTKLELCLSLAPSPPRSLSSLGRLPADVDKVAGGRGLAGDVHLEVSVDAVLHFAAEGLVQEAGEVLQPVRVVGQTEFTAKDTSRTDGALKCFPKFSNCVSVY